MTIIRPVAGSTANWTFEPPVSTPILRRIASEASRIRWYSLSVSVCAGATVMLSPVWTPIGSKFSIEQTITALSAQSRMTSISNSFQPMTALLDQDRVDRAELEPVGDHPVELLAVVGDAAAGAAQGEAGPQDAGQADLVADAAGLVEAVGQAAPGALQADLLHALLEEVAVLGLADRLGGGADEPAAVPLQGPALVQGQADVQAGLAAEGRQDGVGPLDGDDLLDDLGGDRLDVGPVGHLRVGHDRGRVRVDQDDLVPLLAQGLARLGARVVELARLADDDRPGADDQDLVDVGTLGHGGPLGTFGHRAARRAALTRRGRRGPKISRS